jgi:FO synthase
MGPDAHVQAPPNLSADYGPLLLAGIDDWGGISPLTPDFINPEAPWPNIGALGELCGEAGYALTERLTIYPEYVDRPGFVASAVRPFIDSQLDSEPGLVKAIT